MFRSAIFIPSHSEFSYFSVLKLNSYEHKVHKFRKAIKLLRVIELFYWYIISNPLCIMIEIRQLDFYDVTKRFL